MSRNNGLANRNVVSGLLLALVLLTTGSVGNATLVRNSYAQTAGGNMAAIYSLGGQISSAQTTEDGTVQWEQAGIFVLRFGDFNIISAESVQTAAQSSQFIQFVARFDMYRPDGSSMHSHTIYGFELADYSAEQVNDSVSRMFTGDATVTMPGDVITDVPMVIQILGDNVMISVGPGALNGHFGEQPISAALSESSQEKLGRTSETTIQGGFSMTVLATGFDAPHNIIYGPDGALWITERLGKVVTRVHPDTGSKLGTMPVPGVHASVGQDGLMGMAFDPDFDNTRYIYLAYTYDADPGEELDRRAKITRFTYDSVAGKIGEPIDLISGLSGSVDHNSGRMTFGPDGKLYYTIGDQGKNRVSLYCMQIQAQTLPTAEQVAAGDWSAYEGKVLRMNPDGSIPEDNPVIAGVQSHIFTYGHRNAQGIAVGPSGDLYIAEHGDKSDDEFNRLQAGGNYGWPNVSGYKDDQAYQYANWSGAENCEELRYDAVSLPPRGVPVADETEFDEPNFVPPIYTFYTVDDGFDFEFPNCGYVCWPTVAPSSLRVYTSEAIPGWEDTFLMTTLKAGRVFQLVLNEDGTELAGEPVELFRSENRYRDIEFSPDGRTVYLITDSFGLVQAVENGSRAGLSHPGSLLAFKYELGR